MGIWQLKESWEKFRSAHMWWTFAIAERAPELLGMCINWFLRKSWSNAGSNPCTFLSVLWGQGESGAPLQIREKNRLKIIKKVPRNWTLIFFFFQSRSHNPSLIWDVTTVLQVSVANALPCCSAGRRDHLLAAETPVVQLSRIRLQLAAHKLKKKSCTIRANMVVTNCMWQWTNCVVPLSKYSTWMEMVTPALLSTQAGEWRI